MYLLQKLYVFVLEDNDDTYRRYVVKTLNYWLAKRFKLAFHITRASSFEDAEQKMQSFAQEVKIPEASVFFVLDHDLGSSETGLDFYQEVILGTFKERFGNCVVIATSATQKNNYAMKAIGGDRVIIGAKAIGKAAISKCLEELKSNASKVEVAEKQGSNLHGCSSSTWQKSPLVSEEVSTEPSGDPRIPLICFDL